jgi:hypothetical protein
MLPAILDHLTGQDATSKIAAVGGIMADKFAVGYSDQVKATYATTVQAAYDQSLAAAGPFLNQGSYDAAAAAAKAAGDAFLQTAPGYMSAAVPPTVGSVMQEFVASTQAQAPAAMSKSVTAAASAFKNSFGWVDAGKTAADVTAATYADVMSGAARSHIAVAADQAALATSASFAQGLYKSDGSVQSAFQSFVTAMKNPMTVGKQLAELNGELMSAALKKGLASGDPLIHQQALDMQQQINDRIAQLKTLLPADGTTAVQGLASSIKGGKGAIDSAVTTATSSLFSLDTHTWGYKVGGAWISGFAQAVDGGASTIASAIARATRATKGQSPPTEGPLREIDKWGENIGLAWHGGLLKGLGVDVSGALGGLVKSLSGPGSLPVSIAGSIASVGAAGGPSTTAAVQGQIHIHIGTLIANEAGLAELGRRIERATGLSQRTRLPLAGAFGN